MNSEIFRLNFEDLLWFLFIILAILNIRGDYDEKKYIESHYDFYDKEANHIFTLTLTITFFIYLYFLVRNYRNYMRVPSYQKEVYLIRLFGSCFFVADVFLLLVFQKMK